MLTLNPKYLYTVRFLCDVLRGKTRDLSKICIYDFKQEFQAVCERFERYELSYYEDIDRD